MIHSKRRPLLLALVLVAVALLAFFTPADAADQIFQFDIPAEPLSQALTDFSQASSQQIIFSEDLTEGLKTSGLHGRYTAEQALEALLAGTDLKADKNSAGVLMVRPKNVQSGKSEGAPEVATNSMNPQNYDKNQHTAQSAEPSTQKAAQVEEVVVTGSRIPLSEGQLSVQPVRSYTRENIEISGQSTVADYLNTLPDVSTFQNGLIQSGLPGVQPVQLHGLPAGTTLTLLDGRRLESGVLGYFDVGNIPTSAVERIEILPVGASAIYGADALGGAVNFVLRKDFSGFELNASLDQAPGVRNPGVNLAWGRSWDRGSVSVIASYDHRGNLLGTQREPTSLNRIPAAVTASQARALFSDVCSPGNVYSVDGVSNLPGLSAPYAAIPAGITGRPTISQFASTAGKLNVCNSLQYDDITPESNRGSALFSAHVEISDAADIFTQLLYSHNRLTNTDGTLVYGFSSFGSTLAAANPYNPFGQDVNVSFEDPTNLHRQDQSVSFISPVVGVRGHFLSDWNYEATATAAQDHLRNDTFGANFQRISDALTSSDPATALNPFTSGPSGTPQLIRSLTDPTVDFFDLKYDNRTLSTEAWARGPLLKLPTGTLRAVLGAQYIRETQDSVVAGGGNSPPVLELRRNAYALFSEVRLPLLPDESTLSRQRLNLTAAARYDHSGDYGGKATWQSAAQWWLTERLSLSGGYGRSYQAPQLYQISGPQVAGSAPVDLVDPFRGNQLATYSANFVSGSNFNLKPETGNSSTLTLAYVPTSGRGLHASLTWYAIDIANYIGFPSAQVLVNNPTLYPGAVSRAPASPQDQQQGYLGPITNINSTFYNYGDLHVAGFDADVSYTCDSPIGQLVPSLAVAQIYKWQSGLTPGSPSIDGVSQATFSGVGWAPRWKGTASLAWKRGPLSANIAGRYIGRYLDYQDYVQNANEIGNTWIFDAGARYDTSKASATSSPWLAHAYVSLTAVNVFNKPPPFSFNPDWYDYHEYDIRGRYLRLSIGARF